VGNSTNPAIISAVGQPNVAASATSDVAIGIITVGTPPPKDATAGTVATYADILAGYNTDTNGGVDPLGTGVSASAQIGAVRLNGNIMATNVIAGVGPGTNGFGTPSSAALSGIGVTVLPHVLSKISQVIIEGTETNALSGAFGIAAQYVVSASYDGVVEGLKAGPENDTFANSLGIRLGGFGDTLIYEV
jgi:hypothetical protein